MKKRLKIGTLVKIKSSDQSIHFGEVREIVQDIKGLSFEIALDKFCERVSAEDIIEIYRPMPKPKAKAVKVKRTRKPKVTNEVHQEDISGN